MLLQKLYQRLIHAQPALTGVAFVITFTFVAVNIVAARGGFVFAESALPTQYIATPYTFGGGAIFSSLSSRGQGNTKSSGATSNTTATSSQPKSNTNNRTGSKTSSSKSTTGSTASASSTAAASTKQTATASATSKTPAPAPAPAPSPAPAGTWTYPLHTGIKTTYFWAGEAASADNDFIQNVSSAWQTNWAGYFGGEDNPSVRCGYNPCAFTPRENPFYFALPFGDFTESGPISNPQVIPWYNAAAQAKLNSGQSILKNRWIQITLGSKTAYAQWQDVGPFYWDDSAYVFGTAAPRSTRAGLDVSPAVRDYLGMGGSANTNWRFVTDAEVPAGPWKSIVTTSGTDWH